jgi:hypothetical protein
MLDNSLVNLYQNKSTIELLAIAQNYDDGYTKDAIEAANYLLQGRYEKEAALGESWKDELNRLTELAKRCSLCGQKDVVYSEKIKFCTEEESKIDIKSSIPGLIAYFTIGVGYTINKKNYEYIETEFKLCQDCLSSHSNPNNNKISLSWEDYYSHPMYQYYHLLGLKRLIMGMNS